MGRDWGSPYLSHCCLHCLPWALLEVTARGGGRGRGQGRGQEGELWSRTQSRRPVSCEYQSLKVMCEISLGVFVLRTPFPQCSLSRCPIQPSPTELKAVTKAQACCHTQSHSLSHIVAQQSRTHRSSENMFLTFIHSQTSCSHTQRAKVSHPEVDSDTQPHI